MKVTLLSCTPDAANLLLFTKQTRLEMSLDTMNDISNWPAARKTAELAYMATTNPGSWEFVDTTFLVQGITRATAQQMTRTRSASFAMQSLRVVDAARIPITNPFPTELSDEEDAPCQAFAIAAEAAKTAYEALVELGAGREDARGILPLNTQCSLVVKCNLRTLVDLVRSRRDSLRAQGEYRDVVGIMAEHVEAVWPWVTPFFRSPHAVALEQLEQVALELGIETGHGLGWKIAKAIDLLRKG